MKIMKTFESFNSPEWIIDSVEYEEYDNIRLIKLTNGFKLKDFISFSKLCIISLISLMLTFLFSKS